MVALSSVATCHMHRRHVTAAVLATACLAAMLAEASANACKPRRPFPPVVLSTLGPCGFDPQTLRFAGEPAEQARCLLRGADRTHNLEPPLEMLPQGLASRVGQTTGLPTRDALAAHLVRLDLVWDYAPFLWSPVTRARGNDPQAPSARYLVIHDTSAPNYGARPFPANIDGHAGINNLGRFRCSDGWGPGHVVINRTGGMVMTHELGEPWRSTKFERATRFGNDLRGLFLHVELVQPRRSAGHGGHNDAEAPVPGFSRVQYERLALVHTIASVRAGRWLIPAFHVAIDAGIYGGHDDPRNFEIEVFARSLDWLVDRLEHQRETVTLAPEVEPIALRTD